MDPIIKEKWISALRSGDYVQGKNYLNRHGEYCCLGVLCELAVEAGVAKKKTSEGHSSLILYTDLEGIEYNGGALPSNVMEWSGLTTNMGFYGKYTDRLSNDNDTGASFEEIAQIIEEKF